MDYVDKLREIRRQNGYTQAQVADLIGIKRTAYAMYESHDNKMNVDTFAALCRLYQVSADELLGLK